MWRAARKKNSEKTAQSSRGGGGTCGDYLVQVPEGSRRSDAVRKIAWQEAYTRICTILREGAGKADIFKTFEMNESQIQVRSVAESEKQQC